MKKIFLYIFLSIGLLTACKKDEILVDGQRPEERVTEAVTRYTDVLTGSTHGWKAYLYPDGGGGYSFYLNFSKENKVTMYADLDPVTAAASAESTYRIKAFQNPTLAFDTYNYMHILADPDPATFGGVAGWGVYSDFEFTLDKVVGDSVKLTGKLLGSKMVLVKATQAEQKSYNEKGLLNSINTSVNYIGANSNLYLLLGNTNKVQTTIDINNKVFSLTWEEAGSINTTSTGFAFTLTGIVLKEPLFYNGKKITELTWDPVKNLFFTTVDGTRVEVQTSTNPILPLHLLMGINYSRITAPNATTYPGWGSDFVARRALANQRSLANIVVGTTPVSLGSMRFTFNSVSKTMVLVWNTPYGANSLNLTYPYTYTKTTNGVFKFTIGSGFDGNSAFFYSQASKPLDPILQERINVDTFTLDYFIHPTTGALLGQFKSIEHADFTFTGALQ
ncbi:DUF4302 domain-containing protein [Pedobacter rhizosphaerae]|uniref:DUF4302 domain-containing protein n=1 Tax=Pedobacter rhizosphaerae TaxID=390241 RepID=A0A1H9LD70_9SPHI|nr:DUF4302 domain-containing protein [Pedobacter rhizosphaerae]SER08883.1 protein of unknown function [Pedobacter rhizosphaerae]